MNRQEEMDLNRSYEEALDQWDYEEMIRMANDMAISEALLEDAASMPVEFSAPPSLSTIARGSSRTTAALMAIRGEQPPPQQSNGTAGANGSVAVRAPATNGTRGPRVSIDRPPPMVGRDDPVFEDASDQGPSMDDPSIILSGGNHVNFLVSSRLHSTILGFVARRRRPSQSPSILRSTG